jgi:phosphoglycolate phosphatase
MRCNLCGGTTFSDMPHRPAVRCTQCRSLERTRLVGLHIQEKVKPAPGARILHIAPELGLSPLLQHIAGQNYRAIDLDPERYAGLPVERFDLCRDVFSLPQGSLDLIVHNHVLEHVECSYAAVLARLAMALSPTGTMLFTVPLLPGEYWDQLGAWTAEEKFARFGASGHVRRFGVDRIHETIGMVVRIPATYDATRDFTAEQLRDINLPEHHWKAWTGSSVFRVTRADLRI